MKIVLFSLICLILIGMISYSYSQLTLDIHNTNIKLPEVLLQVELRDSNGNLVTYIETTQIIAISPSELNIFLDNQKHTQKEFFTKDGKKYERQQFESTSEMYDKKRAISQISIVDKIQDKVVLLLQMRYDSYQTQPGDTVRNYWTIIRPAN